MKGRPGLTVLVIFAIGLAAGVAINAIFFSDPIIEKVSVETETEKSHERLFDDANVTAEDIELVQGKHGSMTWKLLAKSAKYDQERHLVGVERPQLTAYFGVDRQEVYVKSDRGEIDQGNDNLTLYDGVTGRFGDIALDAQHLDYVGAIGKVYLKGGVLLRHPDMTIKAVAVEIDLVTHKLVAAGGVEALLAPKGIEQNLLYEQ
ncbi:MAG: LPS export ABC transporter periplasmic protein LptC [Pseudodesulfovibrio sp.]|nr:LPS export ABC transporter periplasmic protein LptC [Pseudodesulfovibrio sp.]